MIQVNRAKYNEIRELTQKKNLYRQICVKRSTLGTEEMSALKYGIIYWAKIYQTNENESNWALAIDCLIASRHLNTRSFGNPARLGVL